jgi:hypothetical protein
MGEAIIGREAVIERLPESFFIPEWDEPERGAGSIRATNTTFRGLPSVSSSSSRRARLLGGSASAPCLRGGVCGED